MDYASNSHKAREERSKPEKPEIEKIIVGEVVEKPKSVGRKFRDVFFGGDMKSASAFVVAEVIFPTLRTLFWDSICKGSERVIFGGDLRRKRSGHTNYQQTRPTTVATYNRGPFWQSEANRPIRTMLPDQPPGGFRPTRYDRNDLILSLRSDAENVVEELYDTIQKYEVVSVADLYDMLGYPSTPIDNKWGWTYFNNIDIRQVSNGYLIVLPNPESL